VLSGYSLLTVLQVSFLFLLGCFPAMRISVITLSSVIVTNAATIGERATYSVVGKPEGFASGTTGGGNAVCAIPSSVAQLKTWLSDSVARCIVLDKEYNFKGTEGTKTETGCRPASNKCPGKGGQDAINHASWCDNGNAGAGATKISVTYDTAGVSGINMGSNKSLIGVGSKGVIRGKGLRIANGAKNIIIQNIHITELNPQFIWGGDAITVDGADLVWVGM
jgi:pectin lyase